MRHESNKKLRKKTGCPYCAGQKVLGGFNNLLTLFPELAKEADGWDPSTIGKGHIHEKAWI